MRVYIAGKMSGEPQYNYPAFRQYARLWRSFGWDVLDPSEKFGGRTDLPYEIYIKASIIDVIASDAIAMIPGWEESKGATLERHIAEVLNLPIYEADDPIRSDERGVRAEAEFLRSSEGEHAADGGLGERVLCCQGGGVSCHCG